MIISLLEMLKLANFDHINTSRIEFESCNKILLLTSWPVAMASQPLFENTFILRRPGVANFALHHQNCNHLNYNMKKLQLMYNSLYYKSC